MHPRLKDFLCDIGVSKRSTADNAGLQPLFGLLGALPLLVTKHESWKNERGLNRKKLPYAIHVLLSFPSTLTTNLEQI